MTDKKRILLKLTGTVMNIVHDSAPASSIIQTLIAHIKALTDTHQFGIVVGGGNFFRGSIQGKQYGITPAASHEIGMLATVMNGLIITTMLEQENVPAVHLCAIDCGIGQKITYNAISDALAHNKVIVFSGGTGNPFFTTDTAAVLRGLQMGADQIWKGTTVDGVYDNDPRTNAHAQLFTHLSFKQALEKRLAIMDLTAYVLADENKQYIRIFNIFSPDALLKASRDPSFGTIITSTM